MKRIFYSLFVIVLCSSYGFAQTISVSGNVKSSADGMPLPGVNVLVKNTSNGAVTDFDGNFALSGVSENAVLVFTYLGFKTQELSAATNMQVTLDEDNESLDEVVLIGYGSKSRKDLTGSVSMVKSETIEKLKPVDVAQALQGRSSGVSVTTSSGSPGSGFRVLVRGVSSNSSNDPLVIVDGYVASMNSVNPDDIESLTVLKDAQAAIYGILGANGVILVTTKSGTKNTAPKVSYNVYSGIQETTKKLSVLNGTEYAALINESYAANGESIPYPNLNNLENDNDWQDHLFDTAMITNHNVSLSGGTDAITYYLGASHLDQEGIIASNKSNFKRDNVKLSLGIDVNERLKTTLNLNYFANERKTINETGLGSVLFNAVSYSPLYALDQEDVTGQFYGNEIINPFSQIRDTYNSYFGNSIEGNFQIEYKVLEGLTATTRMGFKTYDDKAKTFSPIVFYGSNKVFNVTRSTVNQSKRENNSYTWDSFLNYKKTFFEDHNAELTLGMAVRKDWGDGLFATGYDVPNNSWAFADIALTTGTADVKETGSYTYDNRLLSYFARFQYDYKGKYLLSAMLRRDASSAFDTDYRVDYFKSATAGWKVSEESFMENVNFINFLKLRASYGTLGNLVGSDLYRALLDGEAAYVFDNTLNLGTALGGLPNEVATWETAEKLDFGLDAKLFDNKLEIVTDYFIEDRVDLLIPGLPFSGILGATAPGSGTPTVNAGTTRVKGIEFLFNYADDINDNLSYNIGYNITNLEGEVISINSDVPLEGGEFGITTLAPARMEVGHPIGSFYGLKTDGIFQTQAEVDAHPSYNLGPDSQPQPGDLRFVDVNGDGEIDFDDRTFIGNPIPDYIMGLNIGVNYKNFDFSAYAYAELGKDMVRNYERDQKNVNRLDYYLDRWTGPGTSNEVPRATTGETTNKLFSDFFVEDASFVRIQNIQLGYSIPSDVIEKVGISKFRIYGSVNNAFTFTKYKGFDPAATTGDAIGGGIDGGFYPVTRQYLLGLNISF